MDDPSSAFLSSVLSFSQYISRPEHLKNLNQLKFKVPKPSLSPIEQQHIVQRLMDLNNRPDLKAEEWQHFSDEELCLVLRYSLHMELCFKVWQIVYPDEGITWLNATKIPDTLAKNQNLTPRLLLEIVKSVDGLIDYYRDHVYVEIDEISFGMSSFLVPSLDFLARTKLELYRVRAQFMVLEKSLRDQGVSATFYSKLQDVLRLNLIQTEKFAS